MTKLLDVDTETHPTIGRYDSLLWLCNILITSVLGQLLVSALHVARDLCSKVVFVVFGDELFFVLGGLLVLDDAGILRGVLVVGLVRRVRRLVVGDSAYVIGRV